MKKNYATLEVQLIVQVYSVYLHVVRCSEITLELNFACSDRLVHKFRIVLPKYILFSDDNFELLTPHASSF